MKRTKEIIGLLFLLLSLFCLPMKSQAYTLPYEDKDLPAVKDTYVRFLDHKGETFPVQLALEGREIRVSYIPEGPNNSRKLLDDEPISFRTDGQSNIFYFDRSGNEYRTMRQIGYQKGVADWKITTPVPYVKYFSTEVPSGVTPVPDLHGFFSNSTVQDMSSAWRSTSDNFSVWKRSNYILIDSLWEEQADGTFIQTKGTAIDPNNRIVSYLGYSRISVNENAAGVKASGDYYGTDGEGMTLYAYNKGIKEMFEDETGASITAPTGYTNGKRTELTSSPFIYTMENGDKLPETYTIDKQVYKYQGWYKGANNKAKIDTTYPPKITFSAEFEEQKDEVHIVYKKINAVDLTEKYVDEKGATIDSSWNQTISVEKDAEYLFTPESPKKDSNGVSWIYEGWRLSSDAANTKRTTPVSLPMKGATEVHYIYKKAEHKITERWVNDEDHSELLDITSNPSTTNKVVSGEEYNFVPQDKVLDNNGNTWHYVGWENYSDAPGTIKLPNESVSVANVTRDIELVYYYKRGLSSADLSLVATPKIVDNDGQVQWNSRLTNTGENVLTDLKLKVNQWSNGLSVPDQLVVKLVDGSTKSLIVTPEQWQNGIQLDGVTLASGDNKFIEIQFKTTARGVANQVLQAKIEMTGNMDQTLKAEEFVRIDDPDEPNLNQSGDDTLINIPDFLFGTVTVSPYPQMKTLDAESYTRTDYKPYIRYKLDSSVQGNWTIGLNLSQFTSGLNALSTNTSISLKNGIVKKVTDFNQENESLAVIGKIDDQTIFSNDTSVSLGTFKEAGVYQIDYDFSDIELNLPETMNAELNSVYQAKLNWSLTAGP
ncbi:MULTISPECIES: WxL domain-containing protein [unclassified Enterococcus]|uniref:WxL domain-containing protein n=1 Tax=unclassified Enterococcus TaxID=2608891 RepID=UPI001CE0363C|nr:MULTISPECIES: WxL domain-containing protein [unclassified Enterococcus]MCA5012421.1 WxL domain-containing protein [Enterococcus sp. S23]MCA5015672.1 WxL domain-containing protein [Enterococcus sp. S22(2020)]